MSIKFISQFLNLVPQEILVMAPELQEDGMVQLLFMISLLADILSTWCHDDPGHGTRIARGFVRYKGEKGTSSVHLYLSKIRSLVP